MIQDGDNFNEEDTLGKTYFHYDYLQSNDKLKEKQEKAYRFFTLIEFKSVMPLFIIFWVVLGAARAGQREKMVISIGRR